MRGARVWAFALTVLSSNLCAHPLGSGLFNLGAGLQILGQEQAGNTSSGGISFKESEGRVSDMAANAGILVPVGSAFGLQGSAYFFSRRDEYSKTAIAPAYGTVQTALETTGRVLGLGLHCWPSEFFQDAFDVGTDGNPDGPLGWPVLRVSGSWYDDENDQKLLIHTGGFSNASVGPSFKFDTFTGNYNVTLPLTPKLSLSAGYGKEYSLQVVQGSFIGTNNGESEYLRGGAAFFLTWDKKQPTTDPDLYVPLVGWPGQMRVDVGYSRQLHRPTSRIVNQTFSFEMRSPVSSRVALGLAYNAHIADRGSLDGTANLKTTSYNTIQHRLLMEMTVVLGRLFGGGA